MTSTPRPGRLARCGSLLVNAVLVAVTLRRGRLAAPVGPRPRALRDHRRLDVREHREGLGGGQPPVPVADLAVGDVITYQPPADSGTSMLVTHRIVAVRTGDDGVRTFRTQGDANPYPDPWRFSLTGTHQPVVAYDVPLVGHVLIGLADRSIRRAAIGVPAALVALASLVQLARALRPSAPHGSVPRGSVPSGA